MEQSWIEVEGTIEGGKGEGRKFVSLPWAKMQFIEELGFDPYPGTLNLRVHDSNIQEALDKIKNSWIYGVRISPPSKEWCAGSCFYGLLEDKIPGAVVLPAVEDYCENLLEFISSYHVRETLGSRSGENIKIDVNLGKNESVEAVILDMDGTLLETFEPLYQAFNRALKSCNLHTVTRDFLMNELDIGLSLSEIVADALPGDSDRDKLQERVFESTRLAYRELEKGGIKPIGQTKEALEILKARGVKVGLATGSTAPKFIVEEYLRIFNILHYFDAIVSGREVRNRKPSPDIILSCAEMLNGPSGQFLAVGDTTTDVKAGKIAKVQTAALFSGVAKANRLMQEKPDYIAKNLKALVDMLVNRGAI